jgi:hypothetical protein
MSRAAYNNAMRPLQYARLMTRLLPGVGGAPTPPPQLDGDTATGPPPRTRFSGLTSGHKVVEARQFDLATAKRIKNSVPGATINDVPSRSWAVRCGSTWRRRASCRPSRCR